MREADNHHPSSRGLHTYYYSRELPYQIGFEFLRNGGGRSERERSLQWRVNGKVLLFTGKFKHRDPHSGKSRFFPGACLIPFPKGFSLVEGWRGKFVVVSYLTVLESDRANEKCIGVSPRRLNSLLADYLEWYFHRGTGREIFFVFYNILPCEGSKSFLLSFVLFSLLSFHQSKYPSMLMISNPFKNSSRL